MERFGCLLRKVLSVDPFPRYRGRSSSFRRDEALLFFRLLACTYSSDDSHKPSPNITMIAKGSRHAVWARTVDHERDRVPTHAASLSSTLQFFSQIPCRLAGHLPRPAHPQKRANRKDLVSRFMDRCSSAGRFVLASGGDGFARTTRGKGRKRVRLRIQFFSVRSKTRQFVSPVLLLVTHHSLGNNSFVLWDGVVG